MKKYDDIRSLPFIDEKENDFSGVDREYIKTLEYNERTVFPSELVSIKKEIMDLGKNPGFGIKSIHENGIDGSGVTVAIIDQPVILDHPEYKGKVIKYKDFDEDANEVSSMHGPGVLSLLVGESIGVAPGSKVVYASTPTWKADQSYTIKAIEWIIEVNKTLSVKDKIRAISISACPPGWSKTSPNKWTQSEEEYQANLKKWERIENIALDNNILIISCVHNKYLIGSCYYDIDNPDNMEHIKTGYPNQELTKKDCLLVPTSLRTVAECYEENDYSYDYCGSGGLSWGIPYLVGCLSLVWQIDPEIKAQDIMSYVYDSAYIKDGNKVLNPTALINMVKVKNKSL